MPHRINPAPRTCVICGALFYRRDDETHCYFQQRRTCSVPCATIWKRDQHHRSLLAKARAKSPRRGEVPMANGMFALVDDEDFDRVMQHLWQHCSRNGIDYAVTHIDGRQVSLHRFVLNAPPKAIVDHISRDGLDNRRANLRFVTHAQNAMNRKVDARSRSPYKGVSWHASMKRWQAVICPGRKLRRLGFFDTEEEAAYAYDRAARLVYGEYARLNFPKDGEQAARVDEDEALYVA